MQRRTLLAGLAAAALAPRAHAAALPDTIRIGGVGSGFGKPYGTGIIGIAQGRQAVEARFAGTPTKITYQYFTGTGPEINEALATGHLDIASYGSLPAIIAHASGLPTRLIMDGGHSNIYGVAQADLPINSVHGLKGKRVTLQKATILHWSLLSTLHANGMSDSDVTIVDLKLADQLAALAAGSVDAAWGTANFLSLRDQGKLKLFFSTATGSLSLAGPSGVFATQSFLDAYPDAAQRVVQGFVDAAYWVAQPANRKEALQIWSQTGIPVTSLDEDATGRPLGEQFSPLLDNFARAQFTDCLAFAHEEKLIRRTFDVGQWIEPKYLDAALAASGWQATWPQRDAAGKS
jgi:sulfonate transport system substrate-binding protein